MMRGGQDLRYFQIKIQNINNFEKTIKYNNIYKSNKIMMLNMNIRV